MDIKVMLLLLLPVWCNAINYNDAELCNPHLTLVPIDHPNYGYFPFYVKLHRCGGSCGWTQPNVQRCVAVETKPVKVYVVPITGVPRKSIDAVNHTKCGHQCIAKASDCDPEVQVWEQVNCQCKCRYQDTKPKSCPTGYRWSAKCACECDRAPEICPAGKYWSQRSCGCVCDALTVQSCNSIGKVTNSECKCVQHGGNTGATGKERPKDESKSSLLMLILMVAEFGVLFLVFDTILYRKKSGVTYNIVRHWCTCKRDKGESRDISDSHATVATEDTSYSNDKITKESSPVEHV